MGAIPHHAPDLRGSIRAAAVYFCRTGTPIRLPGVGRIRASLDRDGAFRVNVVPDPSLLRALNAPGTYTGPILNAGNIGLDNAALHRHHPHGIQVPMDL